MPDGTKVEKAVMPNNDSGTKSYTKPPLTVTPPTQKPPPSPSSPPPKPTEPPKPGK